MYELTKKQSIGKRILLGVVILFAITQTLKFFLKEPKISVDDELVKMANETNKHAPIIIDSLTTFNNVSALQGNVLQYNYAIKDDKENLDTAVIIKIAKEGLLELLRENPKTVYFKQNNIEIQANYTDRNGEQISNVVISPKEY